MSNRRRYGKIVVTTHKPDPASSADMREYLHALSPQGMVDTHRKVAAALGVDVPLELEQAQEMVKAGVRTDNPIFQNLLLRTELVLRDYAVCLAETEGARNAANDKHADRQTLYKRALVCVRLDLEGNCNPTWEHADYCNWLLNNPTYGKLSPDTLREKVLALFRELSLADRISRGPARHVKRIK